jgi:hypothetical protein
VEKQRLRATGLVAAGVVAGGILAGTLGAQAANDANDRTEAAPAGTIMRAHHGGPGSPGGGEDLAKALGVSQEKLRAAFAALHDDVKPADRRADGPPTAAERAARHEKVTDALAEELGLSEAKVEAAFEEVREAHAAEHRAALSDRLDTAVEDGKLTNDDKASVLKAFDAGVLGGPGGRGPR